MFIVDVFARRQPRPRGFILPQPRLGFVSTAAAPIALSLGPVGWVALGLATAIPFLFMRNPRGEYQKFDREMYPTLSSLAKYTGLEVSTGWFNELVAIDPDGNRKILGSWIGEGPSWGDKAAAKIMELARDNFLFNFQPNNPEGKWVLVGPHPELGSVVYKIFVEVWAAKDFWDAEHERMMRDWESGQPPTPPIEPTFEPLDPGEVAPPPGAATPPVDPPLPPPTIPPPKAKSGWLAKIFGAGGILGVGGILSKLPAIFGGRPGGGYYPPGGTRPPGGYGAGDNNDWMYYAAAGLLLLATMRKKKKTQ